MAKGVNDGATRSSGMSVNYYKWHVVHCSTLSTCCGIT